MPGASGNVVVQLLRDHSRRWFIVPLSVGQDLVLEMLPNPALARSTISPSARDALAMRELLGPGTGRTYDLQNLSIEGQPVPDLQVRVSVAPRLLDIDGMLGLDFFRLWTDVRWDVRSNQLTLVDP